MVEAAVAAVEPAEAKEVTDADVLSALIEAAPDLKDAILTSMAVCHIGDAAWIHDPRFAAELEAPAA